MAYLVSVTAVSVVVPGNEAALVDNDGKQIVHKHGLVDLVEIWICGVGQHIDRERELDPALDLLRDKCVASEALKRCVRKTPA